MNIIEKTPATTALEEWSKATEIQSLQENLLVFDEIEGHILDLCNALRYQESLTCEIKKGNLIDPVCETGYILGKLRELRIETKNNIEDLSTE